jgi:hypothetical protein
MSPLFCNQRKPSPPAGIRTGHHIQFLKRVNAKLTTQGNKITACVDKQCKFLFETAKLIFALIITQPIKFGT